MQIDDKQITKFQMLYEKYFGESISREDAIKQGLKIINLIESVLKEKSKYPLKMFQGEKINN